MFWGGGGLLESEVQNDGDWWREKIAGLTLYKSLVSNLNRVWQTYDVQLQLTVIS